MTWLARIALVAAAVGVMYMEGSYQRSPGIWFAVAWGLMMAAVFVHVPTLSQLLGTHHCSCDKPECCGSCPPRQ